MAFDLVKGFREPVAHYAAHYFAGPLLRSTDLQVSPWRAEVTVKPRTPYGLIPWGREHTLFVP